MVKNHKNGGTPGIEQGNSHIHLVLLIQLNAIQLVQTDDKFPQEWKGRLCTVCTQSSWSPWKSRGSELPENMCEQTN